MANPDKLKFYESMKDAAIEQQIKYGIPASVTLAQMYIESRASGGGPNAPAAQCNNYFGIHDDNGYWRKHGGRTQQFNDAGRMHHFRAYDTVEQGIEDHSRFFFQNKIYSACYSLSSDDHSGWALGICRAGYAAKPKEDPDRYAKAIEREIRDYGLDRYDQEAIAKAVRENRTIGYMRSQAGSHVMPSGQSTLSVPEESQQTVAMAYCFPITGDMTVTSLFGPRKAPCPGASTYHGGIDISVPRGTPVLATERGTVVAIKNDLTEHDSAAIRQQKPNKGGNYVIVEYPRSDGSSYYVSYCHLTENGVKVKKGDTVNAGDILGYSGSTGNGTGPHLHMTVKKGPTGSENDNDRTKVDPLTYLAEISVRGDLQGTAVKKGTHADLLADLKGSVDTTPTPADTWLADQQKPNLTDEQRHNAEEGALLANATGSNDSKNMLAYLLGMNGDQASQGADLFSSLISALFMAAIGMAKILNDEDDNSQTVDDTRRIVPSDTEDHTLVKRHREGIDPVRARELATMNFEAESPEENLTVQRQRL